MIDTTTLVIKAAAIVVAVCGAITAARSAYKRDRSKKEDSASQSVEFESEPPSHPFLVIRRVLVLDDEKSFLEILRVSLNGDFEVRSFSDPFEALADVLDGYRHGKRFDVAIIDYRIEKMNGPEVVKVFRALEHAARRRPTKIAFLSGIGHVLDKKEFAVDAIWRKPQDSMRLKELITDLLAS